MSEEQSKAENEGTTENDEPRVLWENDVSKTPEYYASMAYVDETVSDVTILFGSFFKEEPKISHQICKARVVMSHSSFLDFADRITKEALFLRRLYKLDNLPTIADIDDAHWQAAFEEVYGKDSDN